MYKNALTFILLSVTMAQANEDIQCNENGAVVTRMDGTVLYLGKSCDAARRGGGEGTWFNAASFLAVFIDGQSYRVAEGSGIDCLPFCQSQL